MFQESRPWVPCNHLLLLVGGVASAAQDFSRRGQEVEAVVFEVLVHQRQENLSTQRGQQELWEWRTTRLDLSPELHSTTTSWRGATAYLGKELYLLLVRRLLNPAAADHGLCLERSRMTSLRKCKLRFKKKGEKSRNKLSHRGERWTPGQCPSTWGASGGSRRQNASQWRRCPAPCPSAPWGTKEDSVKAGKALKTGSRRMKSLLLPCHRISIELEELQQVLSLLPVPGLLLSGQGVIRHEQGVGATAW